MSQHAMLSPSGAHRWLVCTPCAQLEQQIEDKGSDYAAEGTLAHEVGELKLRKLFIDQMIPEAYKKALAKIKRTALYENGEKRDPNNYWPEILSCTDTYTDYVNKVATSFESQPYVAVEQHIDISDYAPDCFGTSDCIIIGSETLHVIDYKHGKGVRVDAQDNPQMKLYALGALTRYNLLYHISKVVMTIIQPRLDNISEAEISADDLINWGVFTVRPKAQAAFKGEGEYLPGEHCRFCRAKGQCRVRAGINTALEDFKGINAPSLKETGNVPLPPLLTDAEVGEVLKKLKLLKVWAKDIEAYALTAITAGKSIPGWKVVEGRSVREFTDIDAAFNAITAAGYDEKLLYERKPLTLTNIETLLGKSKFSQVAGKHVIKPTGKPTLASDTDKRPSFRPHSAASDFAGITTQ